MAAFPALRPDLGVMEGYHSAQVEVDVRLNTNESPLPPPRAFLAELAEHVASTSLNRYPDRQAWALREALADAHRVRPEQVFVANGSNEVLQCLLLAYAGPGRSVASFEPTYAMHGTIARMVGADVAVGERGPGFELDLDEVARLCREAAPTVTFVCSPNNPTGMAEDEAAVRAVLDLVPGLVVVDEAYGQFADWSALALVDDDVPLVVTRTYSKTWSMAGVRLGYCIGPERVIAPLWDKAALPYHLDALKQAAGTAALRYTAEMESRVAQLVAGREAIVSGLAAMPVTVWPSQANFVLFRPELPGRTGADVWRGLVERSVLVRDCSSWPRLDGCLRVTVGTPDENARFLAALGEVLDAQEATP